MHKHHIVPKHMGGTDEPSNLKLVSVAEHAEEHRKLYDLYGHWQDYLAWKGLSGQMDKEEIIKQAARLANLGKKRNFANRRPMSEETKTKIKTTTKGRKPSDACMKASQTPEANRKRSLAAQNPSAETRQKSSKRMTTYWQNGTLKPQVKKLTTEDVRDIRHSSESSSCLAKRYNVKQSTICNIIARRIHKGVS